MNSLGGGLQESTEVEKLVEEKDSYIARLQLIEERQHEDLADDVARLLNALRVNRAARQHVDEHVSTSMREICETISAGTLRERQERHAAETCLERLADETMSEVKCKLAEDAMVQAQSAAYAKEISDEISHLYTSLEQARQYRVEKGQRLVEGVKLKLGEIRDAVSAEQRIRLESQNTLLELFGQMGQKMEQELESARRERHLSTDRLITVMETILPKMDEAYRKGVAKCRERLTDQCEARNMASIAAANFQTRRKAGISFRGSIALI